MMILHLPARRDDREGERENIDTEISSYTPFSYEQMKNPISPMHIHNSKKEKNMYKK